MIYKLGEGYIDLNDLNYVSDVNCRELSRLGSTDDFYFGYIINGIKIYHGCNEDKNSVIIQRNNLIKAWKEYKDEK